MRTYSQLFALREFRALFFSRCLVIASLSLASLALATIVFEETGSPVLSSLALFGGSLVTLVASLSALSLSDRIDARTGNLVALSVTGAQAALQAIPGLPISVRFGLLALSYLATAVFGGSVIRMLRAIVPEDGFILGRATLNVAVGLMQVLAFAGGALLLRLFDTAGAFLLAAALMVAAGGVLAFGVSALPGTHRGGSVVKDTHRVNAHVLGSPVLRPILLSAWLPNGLIVGCEGLFIPYGGKAFAGYLFAAGAAGMLFGDVIVGRLLHPRMRDRLLTPLRLLLAVPYLGFFAHPPVGVALALPIVASVGYAASLVLQDRLAHEADPQIEGQVFGLFGNGQLVGQALGAIVGGVLATWLPPASAMGCLAASSVAVTLALGPGLRRSRRPSTGWE